jgi:hypothetical protein
MTTINETVESVGTRLGNAIAQTVISEDLDREWTGLEAQDVDLIPAGMDRDAVEEVAERAYTETVVLVCGNQVQVDKSGVGHAWVNVYSADIPAQIRSEIECEMIDGGQDECSDYVASNGLHYRW